MKIPFSTSKHKEHSHTKTCCCGGHNSSNPKSNKLHNSTKLKLLIKNTRKWLKVKT
ncbi:MAG: hypothetical protein J7L15_04560 [Clostridiales bacterium]|nr:hypothetical protein [Clostridiales bacterium]